jgi:hypothetical protein
MICFLVSAVSLTACSAAPTPCQPTPIRQTGKIPSVEASPQIAAIAGLLTDGHPPQTRRPAHILWLVDSRRAGNVLHVLAGRQDSGQSFQVDAPLSRVSGLRAEFSSTLVFPQAGCWLVHTQTGSTDATVTFEVRPPPGSGT